jgi:hypothetical protein
MTGTAKEQSMRTTLVMNGARWTAIAALVASLGLGGCGRAGTPAAAVEDDQPATVESIDGSDVKRLRLTERAAQRVGIQTVAVTAAPRGSAQGAAMTVVPYSAVLYHPDGTTWVFTVPEPLAYVRSKVVVATVTGANGTEALLTDGPPVGTLVVSVGVIELWGTELGVGA